MINSSPEGRIDAVYDCGACSIYDVSCVRVNATCGWSWRKKYSFKRKRVWFFSA